MVPQIFKYLIGVKDVEVRLTCRFDWHDSIVGGLIHTLNMCCTGSSISDFYSMVFH